MILLDNTVISNFAHIERADLLRLALPDAYVTHQVLTELERGVASGQVPDCDWHWLTQTTLSSAEVERLAEMQALFGEGEAASLAVALERNDPDDPVIFFSDDRDARQYACRHGLMVSGTLGVLVQLVAQNHLTPVQADAHLKAMIDCGYRAPVTSLADIHS